VLAAISALHSASANQAQAGHPLQLQLPWPSQQHRIGAGGQSYNCGGHTDSSNFNGKAIDFEFATGNTVAAVAAGTIVGGSNDGTDTSRGNYLEIRHGATGGHRSRYLHLRTNAQGGAWATGISIGATVRQGQLIGYSGNTGNSTGPHLHFDLKLYPAGTSPNVAPTASITPEPMSSRTNLGQWGFCSTLANKNSPYWYPDGDGDGYSEGTETYVGTSVTSRCGAGASTETSAAWPPDLVDRVAGTNSTDRINTADVQSFLTPVRRLNTSPGDADYHPRWDLVPGNGGTGEWINVQDMQNLAFVFPPMFGGTQRAFNGPVCSN